MKTNSPNSAAHPWLSGQPSLQTRTLGAAGLHLLIAYATLVAYGYLSYRWFANSLIQFWLLTLVVSVMLGVISFVFFWRTYLPILKFLGAIQTLETEQRPDDSQPPQDSAMASHLTSLSSLLVQLKDSKDRELTTKVMKKQAEIDALQSQINPHFLYNTLEAIRGQAIVEGVDEIADMTEALSAFFRYSVSQRGSIVTLEDELKSVDNYFAIQYYRFGDRFSLVKLLDDNADLLRYQLPKLTLQPIVENAIYHGLEGRIGKGCITIRVTVTNQRLIINVVDNGIGIEKSKLDELNDQLSQGIEYSAENHAIASRGIAIVNVNQRIKLNFGESYGLWVYSTPDLGTDVEIGLPLIKEE
jgi:two-component system sensor histidine kinase YesM